MIDHTRPVLHRSTDRICNSWPWALDDLDAYGYPKAHAYDTTIAATSDTTVETVALGPTCQAITWIDNLTGMLAGYGLAQTVRYYTPTIAGIWRNRIHTHIDRWHISEKTITATIRVANQAAILWPDRPKPGTIGRNGQATDEPCGLCQLPAPSGRNNDGQLLARRIDGIPYHTLALPGQHDACYWQVWRQRRRPTG